MTPAIPTVPVLLTFDQGQQVWAHVPANKFPNAWCGSATEYAWRRMRDGLPLRVTDARPVTSSDDTLECVLNPRFVRSATAFLPLP